MRARSWSAWCTSNPLITCRVASSSPTTTGVGVGVGGSRSRTKTVTDRVYFDAITALEVFQDGDVYFVRIRHSAGDGELDIYTHSLQRAHELADALASLRP